MLSNPVVDYVPESPDAASIINDRIQVFDNVGSIKSWGVSSDSDVSEGEDETDVLVENTQLVEKDHCPLLHDKGDNPWYVDEARPLGELFGIQERDDAKTKGLLEDLNLNYGLNGKREKKKKTVGTEEAQIGEGENKVINGD